MVHMTDKLELKHLSQYLPHKVSMIFNKSGRIIELGGIQQTDSGNIIYIDKQGRFYEATIWDFKPILRPLSDLTKEIEHNGERVVPLIELAKLTEPNLNNIVSCKTSNWGSGSMTDLETVTYDLKWILETTNMGDLEYQFSYWPNLNRFSKRDNTSQRPLGVSNQLRMFEKLFEWHFNVFNLPSHLFVDINTLSNEQNN